MGISTLCVKPFYLLNYLLGFRYCRLWIRWRFLACHQWIISSNLPLQLKSGCLMHTAWWKYIIFRKTLLIFSSVTDKNKLPGVFLKIWSGMLKGIWVNKEIWSKVESRNIKVSIISFQSCTQIILRFIFLFCIFDLYVNYYRMQIW